MFFRITDTGAIQSSIEQFEGAIALSVVEEDIQFLRLIDGQIKVCEETKSNQEYFLLKTMHKSNRKIFLDAYRKYQAAVNYGEFERAPIVDEFIRRLYDKDWVAFENVPTQLKYFLGEVCLIESELIIKTR